MKLPLGKESSDRPRRREINRELSIDLALVNIIYWIVL